MNEARKPIASGAFFALISAIVSIGACGGKVIVHESAANTDAAAPVASTPGTAPTGSSTSSPPFDPEGGAPIDPGGSAFPPVANGPSDTNCSARGTFSCGGNSESAAALALATTIQPCAESYPACGTIYVDFAVDGCANALRMDNPDPRFVACAKAALDQSQWLCVSDPVSNEVTELSTYIDCTTR